MLDRVVVGALLVIAAAWCSGCAAGGESAGGEMAAARSAPLISHIVFVKLKDSADSEELLRDTYGSLESIPGVASFSAGAHLEMGRATVDGNYDIGMYMGFESPEAYAAYVDHPRHTEFVRRWKPRLEWLRVYDVIRSEPGSVDR